MPSREERLAQNEARFREINESAQPQRESHGEGRFVCECADRGCMQWIEVSLAAIDTEEMRELVLDAWRMCVPKKIGALLATVDDV